jgi:hypothetical protein
LDKRAIRDKSNIIYGFPKYRTAFKLAIYKEKKEKRKILT